MDSLGLAVGKENIPALLVHVMIVCVNYSQPRYQFMLAVHDLEMVG